MTEATTTLSWQEFVGHAKQLLALSDRLGDDWIFFEKDEEEPNSFLKYTQTIKCQRTNELIKVEYHIVYSISYQVPVLYLQAHRSDGSLLDVEAMWSTFMPEKKRGELHQVLTQMEHPVLFRPFMAFHPCRTAQMLAQFGPPSANLLITFISLYGPYVKLNLSNHYAKIDQIPDK